MLNSSSVFVVFFFYSEVLFDVVKLASVTLRKKNKAKQYAPKKLLLASIKLFFVFKLFLKKA